MDTEITDIQFFKDEIVKIRKGVGWVGIFAMAIFITLLIK